MRSAHWIRKFYCPHCKSVNAIRKFVIGGDCKRCQRALPIVPEVTDNSILDLVRPGEFFTLPSGALLKKYRYPESRRGPEDQPIEDRGRLLEG